MHPPHIARIYNAVPPPRVEQPALTRLHVHGLVTTIKNNIGISDNRYMDTHPAHPVVIEVYVLSDLGTGL